MKATVSLSHSNMNFVQRAMMPINTRHFSFLEGEDFHSSMENEVSYRMHIHKLRIGSFAGLMSVFALLLFI